MGKKKIIEESKPEYPKSFESFKEVGTWEVTNMKYESPSCFNGNVRVQKYRITIEVIEEPIELIHDRLEKLWVESDNHHHYDPLMRTSAKFKYTFKGSFGSQRIKK